MIFLKSNQFTRYHVTLNDQICLVINNVIKELNYSIVSASAKYSGNGKDYYIVRRNPMKSGFVIILGCPIICTRQSNRSGIIRGGCGR